MQALQELLPNAVEMAASSFPIGTGLGADNISPRAVTRLSAGAMIALATLLMAFEGLGSWCDALDLVLIVLLPKQDGGLRPIGLFPTIIRIWFRARIGLARAWEQSHHLPGIFGGVGSSAQHAAWQAAFVAESAALSGRDHIQGLLDLVKAFETVPHWVLVKAARASGYPIVIIRLSLAAYRLLRSVGIDGVYSRLIKATRGITAGSGFATTELKVLLQDTMEMLHSRWALVITIKLFVDDLTISTCGLPQVAVHRMTQVLNFVIRRLEDDLLMEVSSTKSKVLAGRPALAAAVVAGVTSKKVSVATHAKLLGTDSVGGRRRATTVAQQRLASFTAVVPRFQSLRRLGVNSRQMVRSAGPPAILYGCEIMGVADTVLQTIRSRVARAAAPQAGGKSPDMVLLVMDGPFGTLDPAFHAHCEPLKMWATAWWESWFPSSTMDEAFAEASLKVGAKEGSWWGSSAGPMTTLIASLRRIGWTMPSAHEVIDDLGLSWWFDKDSPAAIVKACQEAVRRWRLARVGELLPGLIPAEPDVLPTVRGQKTRLIDFSHVSAPFFNGIGRGAKSSELWEPKWKGELASAHSGGQWTQARKAQVPDWKIDDNRCQLCLQAVGTLTIDSSARPRSQLGDGPSRPPKGPRPLLASARCGRGYCRRGGCLCSECQL